MNAGAPAFVPGSSAKQNNAAPVASIIPGPGADKSEFDDVAKLLAQAANMLSQQEEALKKEQQEFAVKAGKKEEELKKKALDVKKKTEKLAKDTAVAKAKNATLQKEIDQKTKQLSIKQKKVDSDKKKLEQEQNAFIKKLSWTEANLAWKEADIVKLNVGGKLFVTTVATLTTKHAKGSNLANSFSTQTKKTLFEGAVFIDRDPTLFEYVLHYCRTGVLYYPQDPVKSDMLTQELEFYGFTTSEDDGASKGRKTTPAQPKKLTNGKQANRTNSNSSTNSSRSSNGINGAKYKQNTSNVKDSWRAPKTGSFTLKQREGADKTVNIPVQQNKKVGNTNNTKLAKPEKKYTTAAQDWRKNFTAFVGSLQFSVTEEELTEFFKPLDVVACRIVRSGGVSKGFGYVDFADQETLAKAIKEFNRKPLKGRTIIVDYSLQGQDQSIASQNGGHFNANVGYGSYAASQKNTPGTWGSHWS